MIGERIKKARENRGYTLHELGKMVGKSESTMSRIENHKTYKADPELINKIADALGVSILYLMREGNTRYQNIDEINELNNGHLINVIVEDDDMSPELPEGAIIKVRALMPDEKLQAGSFYCIEFNKQRKFRMAIEDEEDGLGFLPIHMSERRISYDREYVNVIGKAIEMKVIFEDEIEYE